MHDWPQVPIGEVAEIFDGPHATPKTVDTGPIFLGISALQNGRINLGETRHVTPKDFRTWTRRVRPRSGDVVFSYETRLGEAAMIPDGFECCLGRRMGLVRANRSHLDPRFFLFVYLSPSFQDFIRSRTIHGATVDRIALTEFPSFPIPLPALHEQRAIASVLGALDDKIDLNRRMNETLEAMARAIFKDWFVDFGPTRAKAEGGAPYLAPEIWSLFPDRLDHDGKPEGWHITALESVTSELRRGLSPKYSDQGGVCVLNQKCIRNGAVSLKPARRHDHVTKSVVGRELQRGDILVNSTGVGTLGRVAQIWTVAEPTIVDSHITVVRGDEQKVPTTYLGISLKYRESEIEALGEGSTGQTELSRTRLSNLPILLPSAVLLKAFNNHVDALIQRSELNFCASGTLEIIRDLLLPKLMSGEIRVKEVVKKVQAVA